MPETLEQQAPWVVSFPAAVRGEDMLAWGKTAEEVATNVRNTFKERDTFKTEREALVKERDTLKATPKFGPLAADAKPEDVAAFRKAWGVPDKPDGYQYQLPEGMPADVLDPEQTKAFYEMAHKHNIPQAVAKELLDYEVNRAVQTRKAMADEQTAKAKALADKLSAKYGDQAQSKIDAAMKVVEAFGSPALLKRIKDKEHPDPVGNDSDVLEMLINVGTLVTERGLMPSGQGVTVAAGEPDYKAIYPNSFARGNMK